MKYECQIDIALPRAKVIELFDDVDNLYKWQRGLQSFEAISGEPGQVGARSRMRFRHGKRDTELIETITVRNLPDEFCGTYEAKGVFNEVRNRFVELGPDATRWISQNEFRFSGLMRLMGLFRGMFCKQSQSFMQDFKDFAETGADVRG